MFDESVDKPLHIAEVINSFLDLEFSVIDGKLESGVFSFTCSDLRFADS